MKRRTSLPAILAFLGAFAALALPARADTLECFYSTDNPYEIQTGTDSSGNYFEYPFSVTRGDTTTTKTVAATVADDTVVKLKKPTGAIGKTDSVSLSRETTRTDGEDTAEFTLVALKPGATTVTVTINNDNDAGATVTFRVVVTGEDTSTRIVLSPNMLYGIPEGTAPNRVLVTLGSTTNTARILTLTLAGDEGTPTDHVSVPASVTVPPGSDRTTFTVRTLDGTANDYNFTITVSDGTGYFQSAVLQGSVANVRPTLVSPSTDPENPTVVSALAGAPYEFTALGSDISAADNASLTYIWTPSAGSDAAVSSGAAVSAADAVFGAGAALLPQAQRLKTISIASSMQIIFFIVVVPPS